jgi:hypothetical protein
MAHFAEIDNDNRVVRVLVTDNNDPAGDEGYSWLVNTFGGRWIQTSYNGNIRKQFAGVGYTYNEEADVFVMPQPFESWELDENFDWQAPIAKPEGDYYWDEATLEWVAESSVL